MLQTLTRALRATGADLPFAGDPAAAHPGVALESWSWRLSDAGRGLAVLVAGTACRDAEGRPWALVSLGVRRPDGTLEVRSTTTDDVVLDETRLGLRLGGALHADAEGLRVRLDGAALDVDLQDRRPYGRRPLGGVGLGHLVPHLTQYWHPHLLGARCAGTLELDGAATDLAGCLAHGEKNWGRGGAPPAWWWGQGFAEGGEVAACFAGGALRLGPARTGATAVVVRVGEERVALAPGLALVQADVGPAGWRLRARDAVWSVALDGDAAGPPLVSPVPIPAQRRSSPSSHQHQDGELAITVRRARRTLVRTTARLAGLERGGSAAPPHAPGV